MHADVADEQADNEEEPSFLRFTNRHPKEVLRDVTEYVAKLDEVLEGEGAARSNRTSPSASCSGSASRSTTALFCSARIRGQSRRCS